VDRRARTDALPDARGDVAIRRPTAWTETEEWRRRSVQVQQSTRRCGRSPLISSAAPIGRGALQDQERILTNPQTRWRWEAGGTDRGQGPEGMITPFRGPLLDRARRAASSCMPRNLVDNESDRARRPTRVAALSSAGFASGTLTEIEVSSGPGRRADTVDAGLHRRDCPAGENDPGQTDSAEESFWSRQRLRSCCVAAGAPSPRYGVIQGRVGFSATTMTEVFGVYAVVLLSTTCVCGSLSDYIGRRR